MRIRLLKFLILVGSVGLAACSQKDPALSSPPQAHNACSRLALQSREWTPIQTRDVLACLLNKNAAASSRLLEEPPERFEAISAYLNSAFHDPKKRSEAALLLRRTREASAVLSPFLRETLVIEISSQKRFVSSLPWFLLSLKSIQGVVRRNPEQIIDWLESWNKLEPNTQMLREVHAPVSSLLSGIASPGQPTATLFAIARRLFGDLALRPDLLHSLALLSRPQQCHSSSEETVLTDSPVASTLEFFRRDRLRPEHFMNSVQQGFAYWHRVCQPVSPSSKESHVRVLLNWVFDNWMPLQEFIGSEESQSWVPAGQKLIALADRFAANETSENSLLAWLFSENVTASLVSTLHESPEELKVWIQGFASIENLFDEIPDRDLDLRPELLELARADMSWAPWLDELVRVPAPVVKEVWMLAQTLTPGGIKDLSETLDTRETQDVLRFLEWILNVREEAPLRPLDPSYSTPVLREAGPLDAELERARGLVATCLQKPTFESIESCLAEHKMPTPPPAIRELWRLPNNSPVLAAAQHPDVALLANADLARRFWRPALAWLRSSSWPLEPTLKLLSKAEQVLARNSDYDWDPLLKSSWIQLEKSLATPLTPIGSGMRDYRAERAQDIDPDFISDREVRKLLLEPVFFRNLLRWMSSDRSTIDARRALMSLQGKRFTMDFWVADRRLEKVQVTATEALDMLFWELQIPLISSPRMIRSVLDSWTKNRSSQDVIRWLEGKDQQLNFALGLAKLVGSPGEGLVRRLENAQTIVRSLRWQSSLHTDLIKATEVLSLFTDARGRYTQASAKTLMTLHQLGFVHLLTTAFDPGSSWASQIKSSTRVAISEQTIEILALQLRSLIESTPPEKLHRLATQQLRHDLWVLRAATTLAMSVVFERPEIVLPLNREAFAIAELMKEFHAKIFLQHPDLSDASLGELKSLLLSLEMPPKRAWIHVAAALAGSSELKSFWKQIARMERQDIERLTVWLESGVPLRLLSWNRLMRIQTTDSP